MAINGIDEKILFQRHNPSKTANNNGSVNPYLTKPEDLVREDNGGVLVIDPNKIVDAYNDIKDRYVKQEDLVIYASLKVYKRANSSVVYNPQTGVKDKDITNDALYVNFLNPRKNTKDANGFYTSKDKMTSEWTDFFTSDAVNDKGSSNYLLDPETFGITNISIRINADQHPIITIEFTDVQGRMLFERGNEVDNPYNIFYTYPYPKFSLKYKGYYGKAVETPLVLIKSNTRFDPSTGNYNVTAEFQSDVFSIFNTFLIIYAYVAPYMFKLDNGKYLGGEILKELYDKQNKELKKNLGDNEFLKYEIKSSPTLYDLSRALRDVPVDTLNQSDDTNQSTDANEILLSNKRLLENYEANIREYFFNNPENYGREEKNGSIIFKPNANNGINELNRTPSDFFDRIDSINEAIKNISEIELQNQGESFFIKLNNSLKKNPELSKYYGNEKLNPANIIQAKLFRVIDGGDLITLDIFNNVMGLIFQSISDIQSVIENESISDQIRDLGVKLGYQPTITNILRIISNNMQTFLIMLDIVGKSANNQLKYDKLRLNTQIKFSDGTKEFNNSIYTPFPNYFKKIKENRDNDTIEKTVLSYPGSDKINNNWFEVRFIEEIYESIERIRLIANPPVNGIVEQKPTGLLSVFQLGELDLTTYPIKEYSRILGEAYSRYSIYMSYSGLLYRGVTNLSSNVSGIIADFETDLISKNVFSKIQSDKKFVESNEMLKALRSLNEDGVSYSNLANFGIKFIGFGDRTLNGSLNILKPIFSELSKYSNGSYTEEKYNQSIKKFDNLFKSPVTNNQSGQSIGIRNKSVFDTIKYKKSGNELNFYSTTRDKKITPLDHFVNLTSNYTYYCDNSEILKSMSDNLGNVDSNMVNGNAYQGLYPNMNDTLKSITTTDLSRSVNYRLDSDVPALTFNTIIDDYSLMGDLKPFNKIQKSILSENFNQSFNIL